MTEIVAVSHLYLSDPRIAPGLSMANSTDLKMLEFFCQLCQQAPAHQLGLMPRAGINNLPFTNKFINMIGATMPAYDPKFTASWSEVTDQRAIEIEKMAIADNKKLAVSLDKVGAEGIPYFFICIVSDDITHPTLSVLVTNNFVLSVKVLLLGFVKSLLVP